jgi:DinB family protein
MSDLIARTSDILRFDAPRWQALATLDEELLRRQPEPGEWSALQCLGHAVDCEEAVFAERVRAILEGRPELRSYEPDIEATPVTADTVPGDLARQHAELRSRSIELVATVTEADLDKTARHADLGVVSLRQLLNEFAAHDLMHVVQAERAVMQAFIPAAGPWRFYFADHDVEAKVAEGSSAG